MAQLVVIGDDVSLTNSKKATAGDTGHRRPKRSRTKLIRLDDLIPKDDVVGGHKLLFGAHETTQQTNNNNPKLQS